MNWKNELLLFLRRRFGGELNEAWDASDYLYANGSGLQALLCSSLYMPELVEIDGSVLLSQGADRFSDAKASSELGIEQLEASFNWIEVGYIFADNSETEDEDDQILAHAIRDAWEGHLLRCFSTRKFVVKVIPAAVTGSTVGVGFREIR